jgi:glycerol-3-phosphate acyltransferase PlsY
MALFFTLLFSFFLGAIPTGLIMVRLVKGIDIRTVGSGNIGATNVVRTAGWGWGIATLLIDAVKGALGPLAILTLGLSSEHVVQWQIAAGVLALAGNLFNPFLHFKGGKGVGTALGVTFVLAPLQIILALFAFAVAVAITRIVSVGSLLAALVFSGTAAWVYLRSTPRPPTPWLIFCLALGILVFHTHRANLRRILNGTERRLTKEK